MSEGAATVASELHCRFKVGRMVKDVGKRLRRECAPCVGPHAGLVLGVFFPAEGPQGKNTLSKIP
jgi:hypothetical protein